MLSAVGADADATAAGTAGTVWANAGTHSMPKPAAIAPSGSKREVAAAPTETAGIIAANAVV